MMLPGALPDPETLPSWVLCWLLPPLLLQPGVRRWLGRGLERQKPLPVGVPAHGAPWAEHQDLEPFLFYLFSQITVGRNLSEIPWVGLRGRVENLGDYELGFRVDKNIPNNPPS